MKPLLLTHLAVKRLLAFLTVICITATAYAATSFELAQQGQLESLQKLRLQTLIQARDATGFSVLDYAIDADQKTTVKWLQAQKVPSGEDGKLLQRAQFWLSLLGEKPDNLKGAMNSATRQNIRAYQNKINTNQTGRITPSWFAELERRGLLSLQAKLLIDQPNISLTGIWDATTQEALKTLQKEKQLKATGTLSLLTLEQINKIALTSSVKLQLDQAIQQNPQAIPPVPKDHSQPDLSATAQAQLTLTEPSLPNTHPDPTEQVASDIANTDHTATKSPIVSSAAADNTQATESTAQDISSSPTPTRDISTPSTATPAFLIAEKAKQNKVLTLQAWLAIAGHGGGDLDGDMGPATRLAIKDYQRAIGLKPTGELAANWESILETNIRQKAQARLERLGLYDGKVDGLSGTRTEQALKAFQKHNRLPIKTGLDAATLALLLANPEPIMAADSPVLNNELPSQTASSTSIDTKIEIEKQDTPAVVTTQPDDNTQPPEVVTKPETPELTITLPKTVLGGDKNLQFNQLALAWLDYYNAPIDGKAGRATTDAIKYFQTTQKLKPDGKLNKATEAALQTALITKVQQKLQADGLLDANPTGTLGPKTRKVIAAYRKQNQLPATPLLDNLLLLSLANHKKAVARVQADTLRQQKAVETTEFVRKAQQHLIAQGLYRGKATGIMDKNTQAAITRFRQQAGLKRGELTPALMPYIEAASLQMAQVRLRALGYALNYEKAKPGLGAGRSTQNAIKAFQQKSGLPVTGRFSLELLAQLNQATHSREQTTYRRAPANAPREELIYNNETEQTQSSTNVSIKTRTTTIIPSLTTPSSRSSGEAINSDPGGTIKGKMQFIRNAQGGVVGCKVANISIAADWCSDVKKENTQCNVLYRNGRVLSVRCG